MGGDGIKLFTGAIMGHGKVTPMPTDVARAAVEVAHAAGKPVFAHPSNHVGTDNALAAGVDILAHTIPEEESGWTPQELAAHEGATYGADSDSDIVGGRVGEATRLG